ncbi:hypothetical protein TUM20903_00050 [Citrobacter koseri]|nr:hypothetical protein TUM13189_00050 [Citrobacter koseri]BDG87267.1 hypothetical protein TUM20903_00050 [Citrobacter koseri]
MIGQQKGAIHIDSNEFDSHEFPGLNESVLMLTRFRSKNSNEKGDGKGNRDSPFADRL